MDGQGEFERFEQAVRLFDEATKRLPTSATTAGSQTQQVKIDAGGFGLWVCVTCSIVTVVLILVGGFFYVDQMRRVDKMQDYLNAIYFQVPSLKPKDHNS